MFDGSVNYFGHEVKTSKNNTQYTMLAIATDCDVVKLYCPSNVVIPQGLKRGDDIEITIDVNVYGKAVVTKVVK